MVLKVTINIINQVHFFFSFKGNEVFSHHPCTYHTTIQKSTSIQDRACKLMLKCFSTRGILKLFILMNSKIF